MKVFYKSERGIPVIIERKPRIEVQLQFFGKVGFHMDDEKPKENAAVDAIDDDPMLKNIKGATSAIDLLAIKKQIANTPLSEIDRNIYYEAINAKCRTEFGYYDVEYAAHREKEEEEKPKEMGFTVTVTDSVEPIFSAVTDSSSGEAMDVCMSRPQPVLDSAEKPTGWYKQIVSKVNTINGNQRFYPEEQYQPALDDLKKKNFPYAGEHPHPPFFRDRRGKIQYDMKIPNQAVRFRNAYIDEQKNVWAEYRTLDTDMGRQVQAMIDAGLPIGFSNRMVASMSKVTVQNMQVEVPQSMKLLTWDVVLNPAEDDAFGAPVPVNDEALAVIMDSLQKNEEEQKMNFFTMSLEELRKWKKENGGHAEMAACDAAIAAKEKEQSLLDEIQGYKDAEKKRQEQEEAEKKREEAQKALTDAVTALTCPQKLKDALLKEGEAIGDAAEVGPFIERRQALIDAIAVENGLNSLGVPNTGLAATQDPSVHVIAEGQPWKPVLDKLQAAFDDQLRRKDKNFRVDPKLREGNLAILDRVLAQMEREGNQQYQSFMHSLTDSAQAITDGAITDSAATSTGDLAQVPMISMAFMRQLFQDLKFLQLTMAESFGGTTFKIPVEFMTEDIYSQDDFGAIGEYDGIPSEGVETFMLEYSAEWLKRATKISKEAQVELSKGPFNYDAVARNLANLNLRMQRNVDQRISLEMLAVSDEYEAKTVTKEVVAATEIQAVTPGMGLHAATNAAFIVKLLCGAASGAIPAQRPPIVRPRKKVWLDELGRSRGSLVNDFVVKLGSTKLNRGVWDAIKSQILPIPGGATPDYAVDFETGDVYFTAESGVTAENRPTIESYAYATNVSFFSLTVPNDVDTAKYYNRLVEMVTDEKAYMGSAPRFVTPDFLIGSLNAMAPVKKAELFYRYASPQGTNLLQGDMYFAVRDNIQFGEHNAPWAAGDRRLLLGKMNATRFGVGSPFELEGPHPFMAPNGQITSAKQYFATQQIAICTPQVIDKYGKTYNPPYRTIKFY